MSNNFDITSSNSTAVLTVEDLFPAGITLEMFSTDSAITMETLEIAETNLGEDVNMSAGFTPNIQTLTVNLEAASPSFTPLAQIWSAMSNNRRIYHCTLVCAVPSIAQVFTFTRGVLKSGVPFASINKTLDSTSWVFNFEKMVPSSM